VAVVVSLRKTWPIAVDGTNSVIQWKSKGVKCIVSINASSQDLICDHPMLESFQPSLICYTSMESWTSAVLMIRHTIEYS
jgi:hypothetical protein